MKDGRQRMCLHLYFFIYLYIYYIWWEYAFIWSHFSLSHTCRLPQQAIYKQKSMIKFYFFPSSHISDYVLCPSLFSHALCHYIKRLLPPCCQSSLHGFPLRLSYSTLTSTKAGTVCQPDAPCRPTAPEVRNKENITACVALKKTSRSTMQAHHRTESSNHKSVIRHSCQIFYPPTYKSGAAG